MSQTNKTTDIQKEYFRWLCDLVGFKRTDPSHRNLARALHAKIFYGLIPNDDNRVEDGRKLRELFSETGFNVDSLYSEECSILEMLIGLALRIETILMEPRKGDRTSKWFWELIGNLHLELYPPSDPYAKKKERENCDKLNSFLDRTYSRTGEGGLFPLKDVKRDQRDVEIWYQMMFYLDENYPL